MLSLWVDLVVFTKKSTWATCYVPAPVHVAQAALTQRHHLSPTVKATRPPLVFQLPLKFRPKTGLQKGEGPDGEANRASPVQHQAPKHLATEPVHNTLSNRPNRSPQGAPKTSRPNVRCPCGQVLARSPSPTESLCSRTTKSQTWWPKSHQASHLHIAFARLAPNY